MYEPIIIIIHSFFVRSVYFDLIHSQERVQSEYIIQRAVCRERIIKNSRHRSNVRNVTDVALRYAHRAWCERHITRKAGVARAANFNTILLFGRPSYKFVRALSSAVPGPTEFYEATSPPTSRKPGLRNAVPRFSDGAGTWTGRQVWLSSAGPLSPAGQCRGGVVLRGRNLHARDRIKRDTNAHLKRDFICIVELPSRNSAAYRA